MSKKKTQDQTQDKEARKRAVTQSLPVELTEAEKIDRGAKLAAAEKSKAALEAEKKEAVGKYNADIAKQEKVIETLAEAISSGVEHREVACTETTHFNQNVVRTTRDDTGETVDERPLGASERELAMFEGEGDGGSDDPESPPN